MSMWPVPLDETMHLLQATISGWLVERKNRFAAFHSAQLQALHLAREQRGSGHPFWWAGFVYFGDPVDRRD